MIRQEVSSIGKGIWCIDEFRLVNAFLVEGSDSAVMIDTGCGLGNIRAVAESIAGKPITAVFLTHSHPDHIGGIYEFKDCRIYMNSADTGARIFGMNTDNAFRRMYVETRGPVRVPGHEDELLSLIPESEPDCSFDFTDVPDGTSIDLGGRRFECILTPGHTDGSLCYLDKEDGILFSGDTVNKSIILPRQPENGTALIERYHDTLRKLWERSSDFSTLAIGHDGATIDKGIIHDYLEITEGLLSGTVTGKYEERGFRKGDVLRHGSAELWYQCDQ